MTVPATSSPEAPETVFLDPGEQLQSSYPVEDGRILVTQTRLYIAMEGREGALPNVRLERSQPRVYAKEEWLEIAPRMGACLKRGQDGQQFLQMVEPLRQQALAGLKSRGSASREGIRRRYRELLEVARGHGEGGAPRKMKDTLRTLHAAAPERSEAAERLGEAYLAEGNARAAMIWLARAGIFDQRFDDALAHVLNPRLPSREQPPPEWWLDRHLVPLLELDDASGPSQEQRRRIRTARQRITDHRVARGRASVPAQVVFVLAIIVWATLLLLQPWWTLGLTAAAALAVGLISTRTARGKRKQKR